MAYSDHNRDLDRNSRLQDPIYGSVDPYSSPRPASGRGALVALGAIVAVLVLIAVFSWTSGGDNTANAPTTGAVQSEQAPAPQPAPAQ